jgi:hypothetical protein
VCCAQLRLLCLLWGWAALRLLCCHGEGTAGGVHGTFCKANGNETDADADVFMQCSSCGR